MAYFIHEKINQAANSKSGIMDDLFVNAAKFSAMAYLEPQRIIERLLASGASHAIVFEADDLRSFIAVFEDVVIVSFKGVDHSYDMSSLFRFWKTRYKGVYLHSGFVKRFKKIYALMYERIGVLDNEKKLLYTGHSLGGAMSMMLTLNHKPDVICTFGSPRVGGGYNFSEKYKDVEIFRVHAKCDWITYLPPSFGKPLKYEHLGNEVLSNCEMNPYDTHKISTYMKSMKK